jgi:predicted solute-binding protein
MRSLRIARIPYLNSVPFYRHLPADGLEFVEMAPRALGRAARAGSVDAGLLSLADAFRSPAFEPLGETGIAVRGPAQSVLLLSREEPEALDGEVVVVTDETSTSVRLLRLLFERDLCVTPSALERRHGGPAEGDAAVLLIGDRALSAARQLGIAPGRAPYLDAPIRVDEPPPGLPFHWVTDLAAAWERWQGLPFVFARWMVRGDLGDAARRGLEESIERSLERSLADLDAVAVEASESGPLRAGEAAAYLRGFTYRFETPERDAIERYRGLLEESEWWRSTDSIPSRCAS